MVALWSSTWGCGCWLCKNLRLAIKMTYLIFCVINCNKLLEWTSYRLVILFCGRCWLCTSLKEKCGANSRSWTYIVSIVTRQIEWPASSIFHVDFPSTLVGLYTAIWRVHITNKINSFIVVVVVINYYNYIRSQHYPNEYGGWVARGISFKVLFENYTMVILLLSLLIEI